MTDPIDDRPTTAPSSDDPAAPSSDDPAAPSSNDEADGTALIAAAGRTSDPSTPTQDEMTVALTPSQMAAWAVVVAGLILVAVRLLRRRGRG